MAEDEEDVASAASEWEAREAGGDEGGGGAVGGGVISSGLFAFSFFKFLLSSLSLTFLGPLIAFSVARGREGGEEATH